MMPMSDDAPEIVDPLAGTLGYELRKASVAAMAALAAQLAPLGISRNEASLFLMIGTNPGSTQSELSRVLRAKPANVTPLVARLEAAGWVERRQGPGRSLALHLTTTGAGLLPQIQDAFARHDAQISRHLPKALYTELVGTLAQVCRDSCCPDD